MAAAVARAVPDYASGALDGYDKKDIEGLLTHQVDQARDDLDEALERIRALVEPVAPLKNPLQYQQYFCATEPGNAEQLRHNEPKRVELYKAVTAVTSAFANLANERRRLQRWPGPGDQERNRPLCSGAR